MKQIPDAQFKAQIKLGTQEITISKSIGFNHCLLNHLKYWVLHRIQIAIPPQVSKWTLTCLISMLFLPTIYPTYPSRVKFKSYLPASICWLHRQSVPSLNSVLLHILLSKHLSHGKTINYWLVQFIQQTVNLLKAGNIVYLAMYPQSLGHTWHSVKGVW